MILLIDIEYTEGNQDTYEAVTLIFPEGGTASFHSGDVMEDWKTAKKFIMFIGMEDLTYRKSSCDHFVMDGDRYRWDNEGNLKLTRP